MLKYLTTLLDQNFVFPNTGHQPTLLQAKLILLGVTLVDIGKSHHSSFTNNIYRFEETVIFPTKFSLIFLNSTNQTWNLFLCCSCPNSHMFLSILAEALQLGPSTAEHPVTASPWGSKPLINTFIAGELPFSAIALQPAQLFHTVDTLSLISHLASVWLTFPL